MSGLADSEVTSLDLNSGELCLIAGKGIGVPSGSWCSRPTNGVCTRSAGIATGALYSDPARHEPALHPPIKDRRRPPGFNGGDR